MPMSPPLQNRIALVTGASRGIGAAVAKRLAAEGAHVILAARTVAGLEETDDAIHAAGGTATIAPLDLRDERLIGNLASVVAERWGRLDILVGNAAILGDLTPVPHMEPAMWARVMQINVTANLHLIRYFDPLLRQVDMAQALFVTSGITKMDSPFWGAYAASKAALEMLVKTYAAEMRDTPVRAHIIDPGVVATAMRASAFPGENPSTLPLPEAATQLFMDKITTL